MQTWDVDFLEKWIKQHAADAKAMGKPFMIEEFGKEVHLELGVKANISSIRGPFYRKVYQQLQESLNADGPLKGVLVLPGCLTVFSISAPCFHASILWVVSVLLLQCLSEALHAC